MSIATAIAALNPTTYWKLDDASGPAASDSSGNGHPGVYGGNFLLRQPGVEVGGFSTLFTNNGIAHANPAAWCTSAVLSMMGWFACVVPPNALGGIAFATNFSTVGGEITLTPSGSTFGQLGVTRSNISNANANVWLMDNQWHHLAVVFNGGASFLTLDGINIMSPGGINNPSGTNVGVGTPTGVFYAAHFAFWNNIALTLAQVDSVVTGATLPLLAPPGAGGSAASYPAILGDLDTIILDLAAILAAVRKTFPTT